jgi:hypothetical protein
VTGWKILALNGVYSWESSISAVMKNINSSAAFWGQEKYK